MASPQNSQVILHQLGKLTEAKQLQGELVPLLEQRFGSTAPSTRKAVEFLTLLEKESFGKKRKNASPHRQSAFWHVERAKAMAGA
ncbi:unnamed protein product [Cladocopium goreaui]|uniref:Uncharacterized protein n=1 Tax=Cladocopium goreaui TaxID=2562237 RepID=A0A9P1FLI7_9DINO|nr:unnamed protein product [Cladocopium goreaui]